MEFNMNYDIVSRLHCAYREHGSKDNCGQCTFCLAKAEIKRLQESSNRWQATAAGLSQDISNAEDEVEMLRAENERLSESLENAMRLLSKKAFEARHE
jgi:predicted RNase H-like nuclease (RuvC/YqgF family)